MKKKCKRASQESKILKYLQSGKSITSMKALLKFDCLRLADRIFNLREKGYKINTFNLKLKSGKTIAEYRLIK